MYGIYYLIIVLLSYSTNWNILLIGFVINNACIVKSEQGKHIEHLSVQFKITFLQVVEYIRFKLVDVHEIKQ